VTLEVLRNKSVILRHYLLDDQIPARDSSAADPTKGEFTCGGGFLTDFLKRHRLSDRCTRAARQPEIDPEEVARYREELDEAHKSVFWDQILNADEFFCLILNVPKKTVGPTGAETVKSEIDGTRSPG
jgi:hypothetical protein